MSMNEILLYALANADDDRYGHEGGYAVIHGAQPIPDLPGASKSFDALQQSALYLQKYTCDVMILMQIANYWQISVFVIYKRHR